MKAHSSEYILPDLLAEGLKLVFCGTAASDISAERQAYYANPTNRFWDALELVGLTPRKLLPEEYPLLLTFQIGLTDLAKHTHGTDHRLRLTDFSAETFWRKMGTYRPSVVAFTSKTAASIAFACRTKDLDYGRVQDHNEMMCWVLPSPSGAARGYWDLVVWQALADFIRQE